MEQPFSGSDWRACGSKTSYGCEVELGIDSFAAVNINPSVEVDPVVAVSQLVARIEHADRVGLDVFGLGEHHRREFLDSVAT